MTKNKKPEQAQWIKDALDYKAKVNPFETKPIPQPTARPWSSHDGVIMPKGTPSDNSNFGNIAICAFGENDEANSAHIVKCVNSYEELINDKVIALQEVGKLRIINDKLVEALKNLVSKFDEDKSNYGFVGKEDLAQAKQALKEVE